MGNSAFIALVHNAALLLALALVFDLVTSRFPLKGSHRNQVIVGLILGAMGVGIMLAPFRLVPDIIFDTRSVLLAVCGLYFGFVPTLIAVAVTALYRLSLGGPAALAGSGVILASAILGLVWRRRYRDRLPDLTWRELYSLGLIVHVLMLLILQSLGWHAGREILVIVGVPILVIYPLATMALGLLLSHRLRRERTTAALQASEARFATFFESSPLPCVISDFATGRIIDVNAAFTEAVGRPRAELVGRLSEELELWSGAEERRRILAAIEAGRNAEGLPIHWRKPSGERREALGFFEIWSEAGVSRLLSSLVDVTDRNRLQATLRENEERLRLALAAANLGSFDLDLVTGECVVSPEYARMLGHDPAEFRETSAAFNDRLHPDDRAASEAAFHGCVAGETPEYRAEFRQRTRAGAWVWILALGRVVARDPDGRPRRMLGTHADITARKESEIAAAQAQMELGRVGLALDRVANSCIYMKDRQSRYTYANRTTLELFGVTLEELRGQDDTRFFGAETVARLQALDRRVMAEGVESTAEVEVQMSDGSRRHFLEIKTPIYAEGPDRRIVGVCGISTDITARKQAEAAVRASEQRYRSLFENEHTAMLVFDPATETVLEANPAAAAFYGPSRPGLQGRKLAELIPSLQAAAGARPWSTGHYLVAPHRRADGTMREVEMFSGPMLVDGRPLVYAILHDITERRVAEQRMAAAQAESARLLAEAAKSRQSLLSLVEDLRAADQAVRENEERWRSAVQGSAAGIWENDFVRGTAFYSDRSKEILGYGPDDIPHRMEAWVAMIHPDDVEIGRRAIAEHLAGRKPFYEAEHRFRCKDGSYKWIQSRGRASFDADGKLARVVGTHVDIHERKLAEERLRESSEFLDNLFNSASAPIVVWDPIFRITRFNRAFEQLTGRRAADVIGCDLPVLFPPDRVGELMALLRSTLAGERWQEVEMPIQHVNGSVRLVLWNSATVLAADGKTPVATIMQGHDITERKQAEQLLRNSLREKEALLKEVHHRVKNNLQVITSLLRLEVARNPEAVTVGVLREMQGRIRSMALLHETLYRSGNLEQVDLAVYLERVAGQTFRAQNEGKPNVRLHLELAWCPVSIDQAIPCGLIVNELVSNCLKHAFPAGRGGEIAISLRPADPKGHMQVTVADDGPGLPADFAVRRQGSLGVQLVEDLARQLGGTLTVGRAAGSAFTVTFPLEPGTGREPDQH